MMPDKINLSGILSAHLATLRAAGHAHLAKADLILFFAVPAILAGVVAYLAEVKGDGYLNAIIAVYAIFSALLINAQVALYTIFRSWSKIQSSEVSEKKTKNQTIREQSEKNSRELVREINANLSYLTIVSAFALILSLFFLIAPVRAKIELFLSIFMLIHFFLTLLMAVKRIFRVFDVEFQS